MQEAIITAIEIAALESAAYSVAHLLGLAWVKTTLLGNKRVMVWGFLFPYFYSDWLLD